MFGSCAKTFSITIHDFAEPRLCVLAESSLPPPRPRFSEPSSGVSSSRTAATPLSASRGGTSPLDGGESTPAPALRARRQRWRLAVACAVAEYDLHDSCKRSAPCRTSQKAPSWTMVGSGSWAATLDTGGEGEGTDWDERLVAMLSASHSAESDAAHSVLAPDALAPPTREAAAVATCAMPEPLTDMLRGGPAYAAAGACSLPIIGAKARVVASGLSHGLC